ncbi:MAG: putative colanic acid biosynthesis acetyltransferase [Actinobacteria bacterium]|nr:putative colanic acid biosynthesis acetyltransferase [Actinomycetota bacterium]NCX35922.1 putative colanic acid biosynthesis acetyltransferase [Actinomycetota bacterium]
MKRDLRSFSGGKGFTLMMKSRIAIWFLVQQLVFKRSFFSSSLRSSLLRVFGASVGHRVIIRRGVKVHFPWKLEIGDDSWIGEEVWFINHDKIKIGSNVCISQRSIICSGGHDYRSASLDYAHKPIEIKEGAWICLDAKILPGVTIGECSVVSAGQIVRESVPDYSMLIAGKIRPIDAPK